MHEVLAGEALRNARHMVGLPTYSTPSREGEGPFQIAKSRRGGTPKASADGVEKSRVGMLTPVDYSGRIV